MKKISSPNHDPARASCKTCGGRVYVEQYVYFHASPEISHMSCVLAPLMPSAETLAVLVKPIRGARYDN